MVILVLDMTMKVGELVARGAVVLLSWAEIRFIRVTFLNEQKKTRETFLTGLQISFNFRAESLQPP